MLMKLSIIISLIIVFLFFILKKAVSLFKLNLIRDQRAWSGKDIRINRKDRNSHNKPSSSNIENNYLKDIADESKVFLDEHS